MNKEHQNTGVGTVTKEFVTIGDASKILGVSIDTIRRWERAGKLHSQRLDGKNRYFDEEELRSIAADKPLSTTEVAMLLRVSPSTVRRLEEQGLMRSTRDKNGKRQYEKQAVDDYLEIKRNPTPVVTEEAPAPIESHEQQVEAQPIHVYADEVGPTPSITNQPPLTRPFKKHTDKAKSHVANARDYVHHKLPGQVPHSIWYAGGALVGSVILFATLFLMFPTQMNNSFGFGHNGDESKGVSNVVLTPLKPFATAGRTIAGIFEKNSDTINIGNIKDAWKTDGNGNIMPTTGLTVPDSSFLKIPDSEQVDNLNSEYVGGYKPGNQEGNLAVLPITSDKVKDKSIYGVDVADGTIQLTNLSPALQALINGRTSGGSGATGPQGPAGPTGPQGAQGPQGPSGGGVASVIAASGLLGGGSTASVSLQVDTGDSTQIVSNAVEVKLATSGTTSTTSSTSGLEISGQGLRMVGGCTSGQILKWNGSAWACSADSGGGGGSLAVQTSDGGTLVGSVSAIEFGPTSSSTDEFTVTNLGSGQVRIQLGTNVLLSSNFATTLDPIYANATETPAAGDITGSFTGGFFVANNAVELGTDTTGDYVATIGGSAGLTVTGSGSESAGVTLALDVTTTGTTSTISGNSGLEEGPDGLRLIGGCSSNEILKWNGTAWLCSADNSSSLSVEENDSLLIAAATALDFLGADFAISNSSGEANISIDYANSGITRRNQTETITGSWTFNDTSYILQDNSDNTKKAVFELGTIGTGVTRSLTIPNTNGTIITSGNLTDITTVGTLTSGTWQGSVIGAQYGGTGVNGASAANGSLLIGNGSGYTLANLTQGSGLTVTNGSGSITLASTLGTSISNSEIEDDAATLGIQTTGNYVATISGGTGLSVGGSGSETAAVSLGLDITTTGTTGTTNANSGLELGPDGLRLIGGCGNNEILKWNGSAWACATDANSGSLSAQENDTTVSAAINTLDFLGADFDISETPAGEANISIDYTNSGITRASQSATITGSWLFTDNVFTIRDNVDTSKQLVLQLSGISASTTRTFTAPDVNGTLITSGNLGDITAVGTITSGVWNGTELTDAYISDTLTIGTSGSVSDSALSSNVTKLGAAIDLATSEVSGSLRATNLQSAGADLGAANVSIDLSNTNGSFVTNLTVDGTIAAGSFSGDLTGNASTATALQSNPSDCSANQFATTIAASGNLTCATLTDADIPNSITIDLAATATALAANPSDCSANQFANAIAASGNLTCAAITDGDVPNSITIDLAATASALAANPSDCASNTFATTIAANGNLTCANINVGTADVTGNLRATNLQTAAADLGAADVEINLSNNNGSFNTNLTIDGIITASSFSGMFTGNAATASALAANPSDCAANQFANAIAANGNLTCAALADADIPNSITIDLATTATALAANPSDCSANQFANAIAASGNLTCAALADGDIPNSITIDLAATATALASNPSDCSANQFATTIAASGNLTCAAILANNLPTAAADLGAADVNLNFGNTNGSFVTNLTLDGDITATTFIGVLTGNASTASALAANPSDCSANQFATTIAANGNLTCAAITDGDVPNSITIDLATAATALQSNPSDCSANQFANAIAANGNLTCAALTDADIPDSITITLAATATALAANPSDCSANQFATTIAASGNLTCAAIVANNLPTAAADLGAADVDLNLSNTNGSFVTNLTLDGTITAATFTGTLSGNATTATALATNPTDCSANQFATTIAASGNLTCAAINDADVPNSITIDLAATATALQSNPSDCSANQFATTIAANGNLTCAAITDGDIPNNITIDLAATATALAANPSDCSANQFATTIAASGNLTCAAITDSDVPNDITINTTSALTASAGASISRTLGINSGSTQNVQTITFNSPADTSGTNVSQGLNITASIGNATAGTNTANIINIDGLTGDAQVTLNALNIGNLTGTAAGEYALHVGTGWDAILRVGSTDVINGSGQVISTQITGTLFSTNTDTASANTIAQGDTLLVQGSSSGIDVTHSGDTITVALDTTEIDNATFGAGSGFTWTFDAGATDPSIQFASNALTITNTASITLAADTDFILSGGVNGVSFDGTTLSIDATNNRVGIGNAAPAQALDVTGSINATTGYRYNGTAGLTLTACGANQYIGNGIKLDGGITTAGSCRNDGVSDERVKENVVELGDNILEKLNQVRTVTFDFKCGEEQYANSGMDCSFGSSHSGVIAQELAEVFPNLVFVDEFGYHNVRYQELSIYTLKSVQELSGMVDELMELKGRVDTLEEKVANLEAGAGMSEDGTLTIEDLIAGELNVTLNFFTQGMMTVAGSADFQGDAMFQSLVSFTGPVVFNGEVSVNNKINFTNNTGGYAQFNPGQQIVHVAFATPHVQPPVISLSLGNGKFARYSQTNVTAEGFDIVLDSPATEQLRFSWIALSVNNPNISSQP